MSGARAPRVALLWHLHQPDYRHPSTGVPVMPWVRMHALRGYRDLLLESLEGGLPVTINVVPSLLDQLDGYAAGLQDRHQQLSQVPADSLRPEQQREIRGSFLGGHPAMAAGCPHWGALRGRLLAGDPLRASEWRDAQVWSNLQWFGATARRDFPEVNALRAKGQHFSQADLDVVLGLVQRVLRELPVLLRRLAQATAPGLSVSPYFHPILPLLVDAASATRAQPELPVDAPFSWPEDARWQLVSARERLRALGRAPLGLWPSEGAVSPEVAEMAAEVGFRWLASDEGVLRLSERQGAGGAGPWTLAPGLVGFFRDRELSDWIGFQAVQGDPDRGVGDLMARAAERAASGGVVVLALDGENPWEAFPDAGGRFRQALHRALVEGPVRGLTLDEAATLPPVGRVARLHTGSWIRANLSIWYGHPDDRAAWREVGRLRAAIAAERDPERAKRALDALRPAEGSDWMWWYGEDFDTPFAQTFDDLFRAHLLAGWEALGQPPPSSLAQSLRSGPPPVSPPQGWVQPKLDRPPAWLDWYQGGQLRFPEGAMASGGSAPPALVFGWTREGELWLHAEAPVGAWRLQVDGRELQAWSEPSPIRARDFGPAGWVVRVAAGAAEVAWTLGGRTLGPLRVERARGAGWWEV